MSIIREQTKTSHENLWVHKDHCRKGCFCTTRKCEGIFEDLK